MLHSIEEFQQAWAAETGITLKVLKALNDASLGQAVVPGGRTLGRLAWHIVLTLPEMGGHAGLEVAGPPESAPIPTAAEIAGRYEQSARSLAEAVARQWSDAMLADKIPMYGEEWTRAQALLALIAHQTHHRGQMTVLMRQAGLAVPGVYGPSREEWAVYGMPAQE